MAKREAVVMDGGQFEQKPQGDFLNIGKLNLGPSENLTITFNAITISGVRSYVKVKSPSYTELRNIFGGQEGDVIVITKHSPSDNFQVTNTGNIKVPYWLYASAYFTMALIFDGTYWRTIAFSPNS